MSNSRTTIIVVALAVLLVAAPILALAESGSARFVVTRTLYFGDTEIKAGQYDVKWESSSPEATVTFAFIGKPGGVTVNGKIEQVDKKYDYNSMGIGKDAAGREVIKQLQFSGKKIRIVFE